MAWFGGTSGFGMSGVMITSKLKLNTGTQQSKSGRVTFNGGSQANVGEVSFTGLTPGTSYTCSVSSSGSYYNVHYKKQMTATATGSVSFTTLYQYIVSYNANGGTSAPAAVTVEEGNSMTLASAITRNNSTASGTLTVSYNANGGSGAPTNVHTGEYVNTTTYSFNGWHENSASGTSHSAGSSFTPSSSITMYAG